MKKIILTALCAVAFVGCGDDDDKAPTPDTDNNPNLVLSSAVSVNAAQFGEETKGAAMLSADAIHEGFSYKKVSAGINLGYEAEAEGSVDCFGTMTEDFTAVGVVDGTVFGVSRRSFAEASGSEKCDFVEFQNDVSEEALDLEDMMMRQSDLEGFQAAGQLQISRGFQDGQLKFRLDLKTEFLDANNQPFTADMIFIVNPALNPLAAIEHISATNQKTGQLFTVTTTVLADYAIEGTQAEEDQVEELLLEPTDDEGEISDEFDADVEDKDPAA